MLEPEICVASALWKTGDADCLQLPMWKVFFVSAAPHDVSKSSKRSSILQSVMEKAWIGQDIQSMMQRIFFVVTSISFQSLSFPWTFTRGSAGRYEIIKRGH
jgi:hypothetical protein